MAFGMRMDVQKSQKIFVFIDIVAGNLSFADFAENTGIHLGSKIKVVFKIFSYLAFKQAQALNKNLTFY